MACKLGHKHSMNPPQHKALHEVRKRIESAAQSAGRKIGEITLIAVSKTFGEDAIEQAIAVVMAANPAQLADYRSGKDKLFGFFVGQVMKATGGKANPAQVNELLKRLLAGQ